MGKKLKVLLVSTRDTIGGAAKAAFRLHQALLEIDVDSYMLVLKKESDDFKVIAPSSNKDLVLSRISPSLNGIWVNALYTRQTGRVFSSTFSPYSIIKQIEDINPDVINLHWVGDGFFPISTLKKIKQPIVWTLHDMWAFTGGCHNSMECKKYLNHCNCCPALNSTKRKDISYRQFDHKLKVYEQSNITVVTPSQWLGHCAQESVLFSSKKVKVIPSCINIYKFKPNDKIGAREMLNLPEDKKIIMFGAMNPSNPFKGHHYLVEALARLSHEAYHLVIFGTSQKQETFEKDHKVHYLGKLKDDLSLMVAYTAADAVVVPSTHENLSLVIMESLACGTPVAAFKVGGNGDLILHQENGYLAKPYDTEDLAYGIQWLVENPIRYRLLSEKARKSAVEKYNPQLIAEIYLSLFQGTIKIKKEFSLAENGIS